MTILIQILILAVVLLILPGYFLYTLWTGREDSKFAWLVKVLYSGAFFLFIFLAGNWAWFSYYMGYLVLGGYIVIVALTYRRVRKLSFFSANSRRWWVGHEWSLVEVALLVGLLAYTVSGYFYTGEAVRLAFPLQGGWYYVGQGGSSFVLNYHSSNRAQRYALDVLALNAAGMRARWLYPADLERYVIFGATVHSPCDGVVVAAVDDLPDQIPTQTDREHVAGNHTVISCQGVEVTLAHLQNGSVLVHDGDSVITGQLLGLVGNSGNTSEPHLHIHAVYAGSGGVLAGEGAPMLFDGKFPTRNTILF